MKIAISYCIVLDGEELNAVIEYAKTKGYNHNTGKRTFTAANRDLIRRLIEDHGKSVITRAKDWWEERELLSKP